MSNNSISSGIQGSPAEHSTCHVLVWWEIDILHIPDKVETLNDLSSLSTRQLQVRVCALTLEQTAHSAEGTDAANSHHHSQGSHF